MNGTARNVGIIGLGRMGGAIAANLVRNRWQVAGFDPDPAAAAEAGAAGVHVVQTLAELAQSGRTLLLSLPSFHAAEQSLDHIIASAPSPRTLVETSTFSLEQKEALRQQAEAAGHRIVDCPLSGTAAQAREGDLAAYASGSQGDLDHCRPLLEAFARLHEVGPYGAGTRFKLLANLMVTIHNVAAAECIVLGLKAGIDPHQVVEIVGGGAGSSRMLQVRGPLMADASYTPATMSIAMMQKDLALIEQFAADLGASTPLFDRSAPLYREALGRGWGYEDSAAVCKLLEERAGLQPRQTPL